MRKILDTLYCSPTCEQQEQLTQLQADFLAGRMTGPNYRDQSRQIIIDWLLDEGCDISKVSTHEYMFNGVRYAWLDTNDLELWLENK